MHSYDRRIHALWLGTLLSCAEGPSGDVENWFGDEPRSEGSQKPDAEWEVPISSQGDRGIIASAGEIAASMSPVAASFDAAVSSVRDASVEASEGGLDASSLAADAGDASSSAVQRGTSAADAATTRADSGVITVGDAAMSCNPARCANPCALLSRCCDTNNLCACQNPTTRMCTLPSL